MGASLEAHIVKNLPVMQETGIQSMSREDPLEKEMATHSSVLARRIPWTEEPGDSKESDTIDQLSLSLSLQYYGRAIARN